MRIRGLGRLRAGIHSITDLFVPRVIMLLYHRVTELEPDPQLLAVSRKHFAEHLEIIRKVGQPTKLASLDDRFQSKNSSRLGVVVTFDDGYADNLHNAKPLLERYDVPATVFVTSSYVKFQKEFWLDELDKVLLQPGDLPQSLHLNVNGASYQWELGEDCHYDREASDKHRGWSVAEKHNPTRRHELYRTLFDMMLTLSSEERRRQLSSLLAWSGLGAAARPTHRPLSEAEVIRLADGGLVEIGAHTVNHPMLSRIPPREQAAEISEGKAQLEEILSSPVTSFAYPYGGRSHYTAQSVAAVQDAGFKRACSNFSGIVRAGTDPWQFPRFLVRDWPADEFAARLRGWLRYGI